MGPQFPPHTSRVTRTRTGSNCSIQPTSVKHKTRAWRARPVPSLKPRPLFVPYHSIRSAIYSMYYVLYILYKYSNTVSTSGKRRHHAPSLCCDSAVASPSRPAFWDQTPDRHDPSAFQVEFVRPCLCALSQCSAPTQGRRRWACGVIGWERWSGMQWH